MSAATNIDTSVAHEESGTPLVKNTDSSEFQAIIPINDYPRAARWKVTNKETMAQLMDRTGASVTLKGLYYEAGEAAPLEGPPKLYLLVESDSQLNVHHAFIEIKKLLIVASVAAMKAGFNCKKQPASSARYSAL